MKISINKSKILLSDGIRGDLKKVSDRLSSLKVSEFVDKQLFDPSVHILNRKSKMLRPALVLMGANAIGSNTSKFIDLAVAAELLHTSSLIHDDMIDGDKVRRGVASVHVRYGGAIALLAGDALLSKAVSFASKYGERTLQALTKASMEMCAGEVLDYNCRKSGRTPSLSEYMRIATLKSAAFIGSCWNAAAVYTGNKLADDMYASGNDLGLAFQIRDDILDFVDPIKSRTTLIPNVVTSIQKDYKIGRYTAVVKAIQLNNDYITRSKDRLEGTKTHRMFSEYADLIKVSV